MADLSKIDTIVFLMMENRSFDHMLGHLSLDGAMDVDGLKQPLERAAYENPHDGRSYYPFEMRDAPIDGDVPHHRPETAVQMAWSEAEGRYRMNGFARAYFEYVAEHGGGVGAGGAVGGGVGGAVGGGAGGAVGSGVGGAVGSGVGGAVGGGAGGAVGGGPGGAVGSGAGGAGATGGGAERALAMGYLPRQDVPVTTFFAENYAVCDRWFGALPTSTPPNKIFALSGRTRVEDITPTLQPTDELLIDWCTQRNIRWRVYHDGLSFFAVFGRLDVIFDPARFRGFGHLMIDVASEPDATFPQVIIIEPNYESGPHWRDQPNDSHAPLPVSFGEEFQRQCYGALTVNPERWKRTVFIITYDEHGGFFDHVPPHVVTYSPPDGEFEPFTSTGPRVPGLVVSPLVKPGTVFSEPLDATSVLQLIAQRFAPGDAAYSAEVAARRAGGIVSVADVLNRNTPRNDIPEAPEVSLPAHGSVMKHDDGTPIARLFAAAGRKLLEERPQETKEILPHLWNWHLASGGDPPPADPEPAFAIAGLKELLRQHAGKRLEELPKELVSAGVEKAFAFTRGTAPRVKLSIKPRASAQISVFNSEDDIDPDGILAKRAGVGAASGARGFPAQIELDPARAWMKYAYDADLEGGVDGTLAELGFAFDVDKKLRIAEYRLHDRNAIAVSTVLADLAQPRFILREADVTGLRAGDGLAMQFVGAVSTEVTLRWADVFSAQFGDLGTLLNSDDVIPLKLTTGLSVSASVSLVDDFVLAFSRAAAGTLRVAVRKAKQRKAGFSFEASMKVSFADPGQFEAALKALIEGVVGEPLARVEKVLDHDAAQQLTSRQADILLKLLKAVGMDPTIPDGVQKLRQLLKEARERLDELRALLDEKAHEIARQKITASFAYEYRRISTHASLLQATIPDGKLTTYYGDLVRGRLDGLLEALGAERDGLALESWLQRDTLETSKSWGFTLGIGPWKSFGKEHERLQRTVERNIDGQQKRAYHGLRGYSGKWIGEEFEWTVDFRADMARFSAGPVPTMAEIAFGLTLIWERREKLDDKALDQLLDGANLWGVCRPMSFPTIRAALEGGLGKDAAIAIQVRVDDGLFRRLLPAMGTAALVDLAAPFAAAMPWRGDYPGRAAAELRRRLYAPLWRGYLQHPTADLARLARGAADYLRHDTDYPELYGLELNYETSLPFTFAGLIKLNGNTIVDAEKLLEGLAELNAGVAGNLPDNGVVDDVFDKIKLIGKQSHHVRALGAWVSELVAREGGRAGIERTLTVEIGKNTWVFGM